MPLFPFESRHPQLAENVFVAVDACVIGDVQIGSSASIWFKTVLRGDASRIVVGAYSNIQDGCTVQAGENASCYIGNYVTIGHSAVLQGCTVGDNSLIGMGTAIGNAVIIGENCIIGAGAIIAEGRIIPANSLVAGSAGRIIRKVTEAEIAAIRDSALGYHKLSLQYYLK